MRWLLPFVLLTGLGARAHDADVIYVLVKQGPQPDVLVESVTLTGATLAFLAPLDADGDGLLSQGDLDAKGKALRAGFWDEAPLTAAGQTCALLETKAWLREGFVELQGELRCGEGELRQDFKILRVLPSNYRVVLGSQLDGEGRGRGFAQGSLTTVPVPRPPAPGSWDAGAYRRALEQGLERGLSPEVLAALCALMLALGAWRKGLIAMALLLVAVAVSSGAPLEWWPPSVLMLLIAAACGWKIPPMVVPLLLGAAIGAREGGGGWPVSLGLALGSVLVLVFASPVALALGVMLQRRPKVLRVVRWVPTLVVVAAMASRARLSW
ncbi:MAG: hypothetical protein Q8N23_04390 [Archangium sp.]|nr:hypothetical protein [Archangium sp.]MDP3575127.1 hypothetical protein [Archangium sp.]